jgi:hypothetical protein
MTLESSKTRKAIAIFTFALGAYTSPAFAGPVEDCYDEVLTLCNDALEDSAWWQKPAVGLFCTGMMAGCAFEAI